MNSIRQRTRSSRARHAQQRTGATTVELAIVLPFFLMFTFAILQFGHALMIKSTIKNAVRNGARFGSTEEATTADVIAYVKEQMATVTDPDDVLVYVKDASVYDTSNSPPQNDTELLALPNLNVESAEARTMFVVFAEINYDDASILSYPMSGQITFVGRSFMRRESEE
jgi:Flp pilus assembly protein TadG